VRKTPKIQPILYVTSNEHKFTEAKGILAQSGIKIEQYPHRPIEIQSDSIEEIAKHDCELVQKEIHRPLIVEDAGMFVHHLKGFPGPYSSYVLRTIGTQGILKLMKEIDNRAAIFRSAVAFSTPSHPCTIFLGETHGHISQKIRGTHWGFDPIFIPEVGGGSTYAELKEEEKNRISHRSKALAKLVEWLKKQRLATD
jgi:XTP/dITP diphosphohydrolase